MGHMKYRYNQSFLVNTNEIARTYEFNITLFAIGLSVLKMGLFHMWVPWSRRSPLLALAGRKSRLSGNKENDKIVGLLPFYLADTVLDVFCFKQFNGLRFRKLTNQPTKMGLYSY